VYVLVSPTTYQIDLKAIEGEIPTGTFVIRPQSVVQVKEGDNIAVATQPITQTVESVRVQDQRGVIKELESLNNNVYSLAGIPIGNYILDVVVDLGSNKKGIYETILVILAQGQQPLSPQQIIQTIRIIDDISIVFPDPINQTDPDPPSPPPGECPPGYELVGNDCIPFCPDDTNTCPPSLPPPEDPEPDPPTEVPGVPLPEDGQGGNGNDNGDSNDNADDSGDDGSDDGGDNNGDDTGQDNSGGSGEFFE
jgi:hypothetical protein